MRKISTRQIGDGKLPNRYWVSVHDNFLYESEPCSWDWADERDKTRVEGKTIGVFKTYVQARELFDSILMGELCEGIVVKGKTIEDRLSGEVAEETAHEVKRIEYYGTEDLSFTKKRLSELGISFK